MLQWKNGRTVYILTERVCEHSSFAVTTETVNYGPKPGEQQLRRPHARSFVEASYPRNKCVGLWRQGIEPNFFSSSVEQSYGSVHHILPVRSTSPQKGTYHAADPQVVCLSDNQDTHPAGKGTSASLCLSLSLSVFLSVFVCRPTLI